MGLCLPILFWLSVAGVAYIYLGYPLLVWLCGRFWGTKLDQEPWTGSISVVLVAHNDADRLVEKLDSILASDCTNRIHEVVVGSDGSTDDTPRKAYTYPDDRIRLVEFTERGGRPTRLNELIPQCSSDIVVVTDAKRALDPEAIGKLSALFADIRVGAVSGNLVRRDTSTSPKGTKFVQWFERWIRRNESRFRSVPGATGALYAIRRNVFRPIPEDTILDDVVLPMQLVERGYHCAFEPEAIVWDLPSPSPEHELMRTRQTIAGCAQLIQQKSKWLMPDKNPIWWEFMSHRVARLCSPLLLVVAAVTNFMLIGHTFYTELAFLQCLLYLSAYLGWHYQDRGRRSLLCAPSLLFVSLNTTTAAALWDVARGRLTPKWQRAA